MSDPSVVERLEEYRSVLAAYFRLHGLLPILVPAGQRVGDVYDPDQHWTLLSEPEECFPGLPELPETDSAMVYTVELRNAHVTAALGLGRMLSLGLSGKHNQTVKLSFTDVRVRRASQMTLRNSLCPACDHLRAIVTGRPERYKGTIGLPFVVGTVVSAKRRIFVGAASEGELKGNAQQLQAGLVGASLRLLELDPTLSAGLGYGGERGLLLESEIVLPVAFAPAFLPQVIFDRTQGAAGAAEPVAIGWSQAKLFENGTILPQELADSWSKNLPLPKIDDV